MKMNDKCMYGFALLIFVLGMSIGSVLTNIFTDIEPSEEKYDIQPTEALIHSDVDELVCGDGYLQLGDICVDQWGLSEDKKWFYEWQCVEEMIVEKYKVVEEPVYCNKYDCGSVIYTLFNYTLQDEEWDGCDGLNCYTGRSYIEFYNGTKCVKEQLIRKPVE